MAESFQEINGRDLFREYPKDKQAGSTAEDLLEDLSLRKYNDYSSNYFFDNYVNKGKILDGYFYSLDEEISESMISRNEENQEIYRINEEEEVSESNISNNEEEEMSESSISIQEEKQELFDISINEEKQEVFDISIQEEKQEVFDISINEEKQEIFDKSINKEKQKRFDISQKMLKNAKKNSNSIKKIGRIILNHFCEFKDNQGAMNMLKSLEENLVTKSKEKEMGDSFSFIHLQKLLNTKEPKLNSFNMRKLRTLLRKNQRKSIFTSHQIPKANKLLYLNTLKCSALRMMCQNLALRIQIPVK